jgi:hypothetical protein
MSQVTFSSLKDDIRAYLERGFSAGSDPLVFAQIPKLITLAERRLARDLKIQGFQAQVVTILQPNVPIIQKPDRWRDTVSINVGTSTNFNTRVQLFVRSYEYCRSTYPDDNITGMPKFYSDYDYNYWLIVPTPDLAYPMEVLYYEIPPLLDENTQVNWLTQFAPNALLYAALLEATAYLKNDERVPLWQQYYVQAIEGLNREDLGKILNRTATRQEA